MTPWKMAMEAAAKVCPREADAYGCTSDYARGYEQGADAAADDVKFLPEPPEFRAAREADAAEITRLRDANAALERERVALREAAIDAAVEEYLLRHPNEGPDERLGRAAAARGMMVRLGLYSEFEQSLDYAALQSPTARAALKGASNG